MFDSDFITNPYRTYTHLRAAAPLHWADKFRAGAWLVTRYADVMGGLHDPRLHAVDTWDGPQPVRCDPLPQR